MRGSGPERLVQGGEPGCSPHSISVRVAGTPRESCTRRQSGRFRVWGAGFRVGIFVSGNWALQVQCVFCSAVASSCWFGVWGSRAYSFKGLAACNSDRFGGVRV